MDYIEFNKQDILTWCSKQNSSRLGPVLSFSIQCCSYCSRHVPSSCISQYAAEYSPLYLVFLNLAWFCGHLTSVQVACNLCQFNSVRPRPLKSQMTYATPKCSHMQPLLLSPACEPHFLSCTRIQKSTKERGGGSGSGMSLMRKLASSGKKKSKSPPPSYSMDNPVFEDSTVSSSGSLQHVHTR